MAYRFAFCVDEFIVKTINIFSTSSQTSSLTHFFFFNDTIPRRCKNLDSYDTRKSIKLPVIVYYENENGARNLDISCFKKNVRWKHLYLYILFINTKTIYSFILTAQLHCTILKYPQRSSKRLDCEIIYIYRRSKYFFFFKIDHTTTIHTIRVFELCLNEDQL